MIRCHPGLILCPILFIWHTSSASPHRRRAHPSIIGLPDVFRKNVRYIRLHIIGKATITLGGIMIFDSSPRFSYARAVIWMLSTQTQA